ATDTSTGSFVSFRIYEQVKCITAPGDNALWFMYEPVLMSKRSFNRLNKQQQDALIKGGKKAEDYFNKATKGLDDEMVATFKKNNVEVVTLTPAEYEAWVKIAQDSSYKKCATEVPDGKKLTAEAPAVKEGRADRNRPAGPPRRSSCDRGQGAIDGSLYPWHHADLAALRGLRRGLARRQRGDRLRDGIHPLRAKREHDLADRLRYLQHRCGNLYRQSLPAAQSRPRQRGRAAALSRTRGPLSPRARFYADVICVLRRHDGADVSILVRSLGEQLALGIHVAGAAVDSIRGDAGRIGAAQP